MPFQRNGRNVSFEASCAMHLEQPTPADPNVLPMSVATYLPRSQYNYNGICRLDRTGGLEGYPTLAVGQDPSRSNADQYVLPDYFVNFICTLPNAKVHIHKPYVCAFYTWLSKYSNFQYYWLVKCKSPKTKPFMKGILYEKLSFCWKYSCCCSFVCVLAWIKWLDMGLFSV